MSKDATVRDLGLVLIGSSVGFLGSRATDSAWAAVFSGVVLSVGLALVFGPQAIDDHQERRELRGVAGWRFGVSAREYRELEAGMRWPSFETYDRICKLFRWPQSFVEASRV